MSSTATNYINRINANFPVRGQDNDSQGFRDNFLSIKQAFDTINSDLENLNVVAVKTNGANMFYGNTIDSANFKNCSTELYQYNDIGLYDINLDYSLGSYQVLSVSPGEHLLTVSNWPSTGRAGHLMLSIAPTEDIYTVINFGEEVRSLDFEGTPVYELANGSNLFEMWSEDTPAAGVIYYVKRLGRANAVTSGTEYVTTEKLILGGTQLSSGSNSEIVVSSNGLFGNIGLVPTINVTTFAQYAFDGSLSTTTFRVENVQGIAVGARFYLSGSTGTYTVTAIETGTNTIHTQQFIDPGVINQYEQIQFTNPVFQLQPALHLVNSKPSTTVSAPNEFKGQVYADQNHLYVTFSDFVWSGTNKVLVSGDMSGNPRWLGTATTATTHMVATDTSYLVATNEFVWNAITSSTTIVAAATTSSYAGTATYAITAGTANVALTATSMVSGTNGNGVRVVSYNAPFGTRPDGTSYQDGDIWYQII